MSLSLLSQALMAAEEGGEFEAPTVEHSFFFDKIGDGSVIASVKAMVLLVLGVILVMAFFLAASRKAAMMPSKLQFAGESSLRIRPQRRRHRNPRWSSTAANGPAS